MIKRRVYFFFFFFLKCIFLLATEGFPLYVLCNVTVTALVLITYRTLSLGIHVSLPLSPNQYRVC